MGGTNRRLMVQLGINMRLYPKITKAKGLGVWLK
jgi:hypothetical protein